MKFTVVILGLWLLPISQTLGAVDFSGKQKKKVKIRYKKSKEINFEELLIQGKLERPKLSVVTGSVGNDNAGLLRLRKDFLDRVSMDFGEEAK